MINFDRVAEIYDATRGLPVSVVPQVARGIAAAVQAEPDTRFLELGVGTGRIAVPIAEQGYRITGVDISQEMMDVLRTKASAAGVEVPLIEADVADVPLPDAGFDVVLMVHILHLVPDWRRVLAEARRLTVPAGWVVVGGNDERREDIRARITRQWRAFVQEAGVPLRPRHNAVKGVQEYLTDQGCLLSVYRLAAWTVEQQPLAIMERLRDRTYSQSWDVPEEVLLQVHERLLAWGQAELGDLTATQTEREEFTVTVTRWPDGVQQFPLP